MAKAPKWFTEWEENDFNHLKDDVHRNARLTWLMLGAIIVAAIANLFIG